MTDNSRQIQASAEARVSPRGRRRSPFSAASTARWNQGSASTQSGLGAIDNNRLKPNPSPNPSSNRTGSNPLQQLATEGSEDSTAKLYTASVRTYLLPLCCVPIWPRWSLSQSPFTELCLHAPHPRTRRRLSGLRDISRGCCSSALCKPLGRHVTTVLKWVHDNERGPQALIYRHSGSNPSQNNVTPLIHEALQGAQQASASQKHRSRRWVSFSRRPPPSASARVLVFHPLAVSVAGLHHRLDSRHRETVRRLTKALGYTWKKAKSCSARPVLACDAPGLLSSCESC